MDKNDIAIREYISSDCREMSELFYHTVHTINAKDYPKEQLDVWAAGEIDLEKWNQSFEENYTLVAVKNATIVGFGDIEADGYLNRLYVHKDYQGKGIATAICNRLELAVEGREIRTHASVTAVPFFEKRGYTVVKEQQVKREGIHLKNYVMKLDNYLRSIRMC